MILRLLTALALLTAAAFAQTKTVNKTISNNGLTESLTVPSGKTLTIASGATIAAAEGSTITGFTASATWGGITGTLSSQTDLQTALDAKANASALSSYLTTSTAASTYQPLDGDLTSIAALTTTSYGRELLTRADAAAVRSALSLGTLATQTATITDYLTIASAASTYQPLATPLTNFANLASSAGVLTNNGSGTLSYTATSTGGNTFGFDAGKIAVYSDSGEFTAASALRLTAGPTVMGVWFGSDRLAKESTTTSRTWTLPNQTGIIALRGDNTFTALQQFTGTDHAGLQLNNLTTTQRDALTGSAGMVIWNTTDGRMQLHNGTSWTSGMVRLAGDTMTGNLVLPAGTLSSPSLQFSGAGGTTGIYSSGTNTIDFALNGIRRWQFDSSGTFQGGTSSIQMSGNFIAANTFLRLDGPALRMGASDDVAIGRDGAAETLALGRRNTSANTLRIYNTYTSSTNHERMSLGWSSNIFVIKPEKGSGGGSSRNASYHTTETGVNWSSGSGSPEGVLTAPIGSLYTRTDGGASTTLYVKESGTGNTGWIAK
jgi:hypothetical protein